jgi:hypothetical protein
MPFVQAKGGWASQASCRATAVLGKATQVSHRPAERGQTPPSSSVASLQEDNICTELEAQDLMVDLGLSQAAIVCLAHGIASEVLYAFAVN